MIMTTPQVLWGDLDWQRYPEWACLCSVNIVFPGATRTAAAVRDEKRISLVCVYDVAVKAPELFTGENGDVLAPGVPMKTTCCSLLTSPVVVKFELPKESKKNMCSSKIMIGNIIRTSDTEAGLGKIVLVILETTL